MTNLVPVTLHRTRAVRCLATCLLLFVMHLHAQATGRVTGTVFFGDTGRGAEGARIWLTPDVVEQAPTPDPVTGEFIMRNPAAQQQATATVSATGSFTLGDVQPGTYVVHTFAASYLSPDATQYPTSNTAHVATGPVVPASALRVTVRAGTTATLHVRLRRGGSIQGTLTLGDGTPAASTHAPPYGVAVNAELKLGANQYARAGGAAHTDATGHYSLDGLAPGDYIVFASGGSRMVPTAGGGSRGGSGLPIYAPGTVRPSAAAVVHLQGTETKTLNLAFPPAAATHRISGSVVGPPSDALRNTIVRLYPSGEGGLTAAMPLELGDRFTFDGVPDGTYMLSIDFPSGAEYVGVLPDMSGIRMRTRKALYQPVQADVTVAGADVADVLLRPRAAQDVR